jgi:hypothetical protein
MLTSSVEDASERVTRRDRMQALQSIASVVAPLTLLAAILGYVGWVRTRAYFNYFGLSPALVGYSPQDYLLRSADVSFGAIFLLGLAAIFLLAIDYAAIKGLGRLSRHARWVRASIGAIGAIVATGVLANGAAQATRAIVPSVTGAGLLALGVIMFLRFGPISSTINVRLRTPAIAVSIALLVLAAFWAATSYADSIGVKAAQSIDRSPGKMPLVTVYSQDLIDFNGSNILPSRRFGEDEEWHYRYTGLRLLTFSNNRWFLIPEPASDGYRSTVTVLPDTEKIRVETSVPQ